MGTSRSVDLRRTKSCHKRGRAGKARVSGSSAAVAPGDPAFGCTCLTRSGECTSPGGLPSRGPASASLASPRLQWDRPNLIFRGASSTMPQLINGLRNPCFPDAQTRRPESHAYSFLSSAGCFGLLPRITPVRVACPARKIRIHGHGLSLDGVCPRNLRDRGDVGSSFRRARKSILWQPRRERYPEDRGPRSLPLHRVRPRTLGGRCPQERGRPGLRTIEAARVPAWRRSRFGRVPDSRLCADPRRLAGFRPGPRPLDRMARVLGEIDPEGAADSRSGRELYKDKLRRLDAEYREAFRTCDDEDLRLRRPCRVRISGPPLRARAGPGLRPEPSTPPLRRRR